MICKSCYKATVDTFVVIVYSGKEVYRATSKIKASDYYVHGIFSSEEKAKIYISLQSEDDYNFDIVERKLDFEITKFDQGYQRYDDRGIPRDLFHFPLRIGYNRLMSANNTTRDDFELRVICSCDGGNIWSFNYCEDDIVAFNTIKDLFKLSRRAKAWSMLNPERDYKIIMCQPNDTGEPYLDFTPIFASAEVWRDGYTL